MLDVVNKSHEMQEELRNRQSIIDALEETKKVQETEFKKLSQHCEQLEKQEKDLVVSFW